MFQTLLCMHYILGENRFGRRQLPGRLGAGCAHLKQVKIDKRKANLIEAGPTEPCILCIKPKPKMVQKHPQAFE